MLLIENKSQLKYFKTRINNKDLVLYIVPVSSYKHPVANEISILFVKILNENEFFAFGFNHIDSICDISVSDVYADINILSNMNFTIDKKSFLHYANISNVYDTNILSYLSDNTTFEKKNSSIEHFYNINFKNCNVLNSIISINRHFYDFLDICEFSEKIIERERNNIQFDSFKTLNDDITNTLYRIESSGLYVDAETFISAYGEEQRKHIHNNFVYSQYNVFTSTGRPSNKFGGISYAAIPNDGDYRLSFVSRFKNEGKLVDLDFTAFHPHLIANLINYDLDLNLNIYEYLGKYYFNKQKLDILDIGKAKTITFRQLYGGVEPKYKNIPYFKKWNTYLKHRWEFFLQNGYIETPKYNRQITLEHISDDVNPSKLGNFILQAYETEIALGIANNVLDYLENKISKVVLYTYDSILIDFHKDDGIETLNAIKQIMIDNKFPIKIKVGNNYKQLQKINL